MINSRTLSYVASRLYYITHAMKTHSDAQRRTATGQNQHHMPWVQWVAWPSPWQRQEVGRWASCPAMNFEAKGKCTDTLLIKMNHNDIIKEHLHHPLLLCSSIGNYIQYEFSISNMGRAIQTLKGHQMMTSFTSKWVHHRHMPRQNYTVGRKASSFQNIEGTILYPIDAYSSKWHRQ